MAAGISARQPQASQSHFLSIGVSIYFFNYRKHDDYESSVHNIKKILLLYFYGRANY